MVRRHNNMHFMLSAKCNPRFTIVNVTYKIDLSLYFISYSFQSGNLKNNKNIKIIMSAEESGKMPK